MEINPTTSPVFFSIVIPLYNKADYIIQTLNSVENQVYKNFEVIIINDGSTDNSLETINSYSGIEFTLINQKNQGVSIARNNGIQKSNGTYVAFLDADDYWYPNHLKLLKKSIDKYPNEVVFCSNYEIKVTNKVLKKTTFSFEEKSNEDIILIKNYFECSLLNSIAWTSSICLKKSILNNSMLFDSDLVCVQDTDLWIRLGLKYSFVFNTIVTATHHKFVENSLSKIDTIQSKYLFSKKYIQEEKNNPYLKKYMDNNRFAIAMDAKKRGFKEISLKIIKNINQHNLNLKQRFLLFAPICIIQLLNKIKLLLLTKNIHILIYK